MKDYLQQLFKGQSLSRQQAEEAMELLMQGSVHHAQVGAFLGALRVKGETIDEITGFVTTMRKHAVKVPIQSQDLIDTCGTGGDGAETFNISTAVAFVLAGAGANVAKHGNRSVSSKCGSADVLEVLGIKTDVSHETVSKSVDELGLGFFFAPAFHPAMKHVAPVRRALGVRTVFNILGPLCNPAAVDYQVLGVYDVKLLNTMASVLGELGSKEVMVIASDDGLDELSLSAPTSIAHLKAGKVTQYKISPEEVGLNRVPASAIKGGDSNENAQILLNILKGEHGAPRDIVLFNAAAGLIVTGKVSNWTEGIALAAETIDSGQAMAKLEQVRSIL